MRQGFKKYSDMRQGYLLKSTGDIALNKQQRHATLAFLKIDRRHGDPPSRAPSLMEHYVFVLLRYFLNDKEHFYSCQIVGNELISFLNKIYG